MATAKTVEIEIDLRSHGLLASAHKWTNKQADIDNNEAPPHQMSTIIIGIISVRFQATEQQHIEKCTPYMRQNQLDVSTILNEELL